MAEIEQPLVAAAGTLPHEVVAEVQAITGRALNVVRSGADLAAGLERLRDLRRNELPRMFCPSKERPYNRNWIDALEARSIVVTAEAMALCALKREESRGAHFRLDHPKRDARFEVNATVALTEGDLHYTRHPVALESLP